MGHVLVNYEPVNPTTWVYLSSLLLIALYFKFSRLWSVRNLDLIGLMLLSPGLLMVNYGHQNHQAAIQQGGYIWLFSIGGLLVIRLLLDSLMVRRPLLEPNLSVGGLTFLGGTLFVFLMTNVLVIRPELIDGNEDLPAAAAHPNPKAPGESLDFAKWGPGNPLFYRLYSGLWMHPPLFGSVKNEVPLEPLPKVEDHPPDEAPAPADNVSAAKPPDLSYHGQARAIAVASHFFIVLGLILIGFWHFDNIRTGIAAAVLYLLLPYTAQWTGQVTHILPGALLIWAVVMYRRPIFSGLLIGIALGTIYYPLFLLPLWISFYAQRGWRRFLLGLFVGVGAVLLQEWLMAADKAEFLVWMKPTLGLMLPAMEHLEGFWGLQFIDPVYRVTVLAACAVLTCSLALWPSRKNLGTLLSCSAVVMLSTQFWHAHRGGLFMAWYLPLMLLTIFRPNLEDRVATIVVREGWLKKPRSEAAPAEERKKPA
ncbi:MAG TPA: glycosyltransferase family 87 protein [Pirellulales bacterium]|jgi:hypothetical protein|nr:glycosyltransferase family 87 protein [Pirellulales bacterium]